MSSKRGHRGSQNKSPPHVRLHHWMMSSPAWRDLNVTARALYVEISARYRGPGSNNGRIPFSVREAAEALHIGKSTAQEAFKALQAHGFIVETRRGTFDRKTRHSTEWRLTEYPCDITMGLATKEFIRWKPEATEKKTRYLRPDRTVPEAGPIGTSARTVNLENARYGT